MSGEQSPSVRLVPMETVKPGEMVTVEVHGQSVTVCNVDGAFYVIDDACPHRGRSLNAGELNGNVLTCRWHGHRYDLTTGCGLDVPSDRLKCYEVTLENSYVCIRLHASAAVDA
jgi:nitrite reductase (NADH) small subunit